MRSADWPGTIVFASMGPTSLGSGITGWFGWWIVFDVGRWLSTGQAVPVVFSGGVPIGSGG